jgi:hypothetical protein
VIAREEFIVFSLGENCKQYISSYKLREAESSLAGQEIPRIYRIRRFIAVLTKAPILSHLYQVHLHFL